MNQCGWQARVETAARGGATDRDLVDHLERCVDCRDLERTVRLLQDEARAAERFARDRLPDPRALIASATPRSAHAPPTAPVLWPVIWAERLGVAVLALVLVLGPVVMVRWWPGSGVPVAQIVRRLHEVGLSVTSGFASASSPNGPVASVLCFGAIAILAVAVHGLADSGRGLG